MQVERNSQQTRFEKTEQTSHFAFSAVILSIENTEPYRAVYGRGPTHGRDPLDFLAQEAVET